MALCEISYNLHYPIKHFSEASKDYMCNTLNNTTTKKCELTQLHFDNLLQPSPPRVPQPPGLYGPLNCRAVPCSVMIVESDSQQMLSCRGGWWSLSCRTWWGGASPGCRHEPCWRLSCVGCRGAALPWAAGQQPWWGWGCRHRCSCGGELRLRLIALLPWHNGIIRREINFFALQGM